MINNTSAQLNSSLDAQAVVATPAVKTYNSVGVSNKIKLIQCLIGILCSLLVLVSVCFAWFANKTMIDADAVSIITNSPSIKVGDDSNTIVTIATFSGDGESVVVNYYRQNQAGYCLCDNNGNYMDSNGLITTNPANYVSLVTNADMNNYSNTLTVVRRIADGDTISTTVFYYKQFTDGKYYLWHIPTDGSQGYYCNEGGEPIQDSASYMPIVLAGLLPGGTLDFYIPLTSSISAVYNYDVNMVGIQGDNFKRYENATNISSVSAMYQLLYSADLSIVGNYYKYSGSPNEDFGTNDVYYLSYNSATAQKYFEALGSIDISYAVSSLDDMDNAVTSATIGDILHYNGVDGTTVGGLVCENTHAYRVLSSNNIEDLGVNEYSILGCYRMNNTTTVNGEIVEGEDIWLATYDGSMASTSITFIDNALWDATECRTMTIQFRITLDTTQLGILGNSFVNVLSEKTFKIKGIYIVVDEVNV